MATQLQKGIKVEAEHKKTIRFLKAYSKNNNGRFPSDREIQKRISLDHLRENKDYYKKLIKCGL